MPLPHFTKLSNSLVGVPGPGGNPAPQEVLYKNLFEITFVLPTLVQTAFPANAILLLQNATKLNLALTEFDITTKEQRFKYSTRVFVTTPNKTSGTITIPIQMNVSSGGVVETWNTMKYWYDLVFNSQNGALHYKSDIVGTIIINIHDKKGIVLRRVTYQNCQLTKISGGWDVDWASNDIMDSISCEFAYDYFVDEYIGGETAPETTLITGYGA